MQKNKKHHNFVLILQERVEAHTSVCPSTGSSSTASCSCSSWNVTGTAVSIIHCKYCFHAVFMLVFSISRTICGLVIIFFIKIRLNIIYKSSNNCDNLLHVSDIGCYGQTAVLCLTASCASGRSSRRNRRHL